MLKPQEMFGLLDKAGIRFEVIEAHKNYRIMRLDVDDTYQPTPEQAAFIEAYGSAVASATDEEVLAFFAEDAPSDGDAFSDKWSTGTYSTIMDAWCVWRFAIDYAKETK